MTAAPEYEAYLFEQWTPGVFDDNWAQPGLYAAGYYAQSADVPQVHMSSWYDPYVRTATENYQGLVTRKRGPVRLILGPWTHGNRSFMLCREVDFGPMAPLDANLAPDFCTLRLRGWTAGYAAGQWDRTEPAVRVFVMGGGGGRRNAAGRLERGGRWRRLPPGRYPTRSSPPTICIRMGPCRPTRPLRRHRRGRIATIRPIRCPP